MPNIPARAGFYMPAEWETHEGVWLQWPHDQATPGTQLKLERTWLTLVNVLRQYGNVHVITCDEAQRDHVEGQCEYFGIWLENVGLHVIPTDDVWVRDNGPLFVVNDEGDLAITNWSFNGWGRNYPHELDDQVPAIVGEKLSLPVYNAPLVLEGGAVEVNGQGTLMATRSSIIDPQRNPGQSQAEIEAILGQYLGARHFIWLAGAGQGECEKWGDETDSHIDLVARFTDESTVLYNWTDDKADPRYPMLARHLEELRQATTESGQALTLVPLPLPKNGVYQVTQAPWRRYALTDAAYSNYLVSNGVVLVPVFGNAHDERARAIIAEQFPSRKVVGIDAVALVEDGGAIHCVTQQQPAILG